MTAFKATSQEIETKKVNILELFDEKFWFRIPAYQRSYVWGKDQLDDLLDDLRFAFSEHPKKEYFLGSVVLQRQQVLHEGLSEPFVCYDVLDGQQRLTSLFLLMSVLRDITDDEDVLEQSTKAVFKKGSRVAGRPDLLRLSFEIRDQVELFIDEIVKPTKGTNKVERLQEFVKHPNVSLSHMASATLFLREELQKYKQKHPDLFDEFAIFIFAKVIMIYVASESMEDAFRMFTVLNARGIPLRNSDILKSMNLGMVQDSSKHLSYAREWEGWEAEFGDDFDRFLGYIRTILTKEKSRENLLEEYEKLYKDGVLKKGEDTFKKIKTYEEYHDKILSSDDLLGCNDFELRNLLTIMQVGISSTDWIPPLLFFYHRFRLNDFAQFLKKLESKFAANRILGLSHTKRLSSTFNMLKVIESASTSEDIINHPNIFSYDRQHLEDVLSGSIYHHSFARYIMLKVEQMKKDHSSSFGGFERISIEHVLPQNPPIGSNWRTTFSHSERESWTHRLANLVLISRRKNSSLSNKDFDEKKKRYFQKSIQTYPNVAKVVSLPEWTPQTLATRQTALIQDLMAEFK